MARMKNLMDLTWSPPRHFSPASSNSTPAAVHVNRSWFIAVRRMDAEPARYSSAFSGPFVVALAISEQGGGSFTDLIFSLILRLALFI
jgi:hypothetical protein